eukprot:gene22148-23207_t
MLTRVGTECAPQDRVHTKQYLYDDGRPRYPTDGVCRAASANQSEKRS